MSNRDLLQQWKVRLEAIEDLKLISSEHGECFQNALAKVRDAIQKFALVETALGEKAPNEYAVLLTLIASISELVQSNAVLLDLVAKAIVALQAVAEIGPAVDRSMRASRHAKKKNEVDPKQAAKREAHALWKERHAGMHPKLRTREQFATEVMRRWPVLTSSAVICDWSTKWGKAVKAGK